MTGLGTVINAGGIVLGGLLGLIIGKRLQKRFQDILICVLGLSVIFISIAGAIREMIAVTDGQLSVRGTMMLIFSLVIGAIVGELINIQKWTERFGEWLKRKAGGKDDSGFVTGFVQSSLTVCVGAMAIIGSLNDGLFGDYSILLTKTVLDAAIVMIMAASHGKGCIFSAIPVVILQGGVTLLARFVQPVMTQQALSNLSLVGSVLIFCVGINLTFDKHIKVGNMLPALVLAVAAAFIPFLK